MKKIYLLISVLFLFFSCSKDPVGSIHTDPGSGSNTGDGPSTLGCGYYNGQPLQLGPQGGCYYINGNGRKVYVDRSECKCN